MTDFTERVRALDKAATAGPWGVDGSLFGPEASRNGQAWGLNWRQDLEWVAAARSMLPAAGEALARVRELHTPASMYFGGSGAYCVHCDGNWPCETYQATAVEE